MESKPNQTPSNELEEQLQQYDKMLNVLTHPDWREFYLFLTERANGFQQEMNHANSWELFLVARGLRQFTDYLMSLPTTIKAAKEELESEIAFKIAVPDDEFSPPEYERDE